MALAAALHVSLPVSALAETPKPSGATRQGQDLVARAQALFEDQQYEESIQTLSGALVRPNNTKAQKVEIYRLLALNYITLTHKEEAEGAVRGLLALEPAYELPPRESPRFRDFFSAVKQKWEAEGRPGLVKETEAPPAPVTMKHASPAQATAGTQIGLTATLDDPQSRVAKVTLYFRSGSDVRFEPIPGTLDGTHVSASIPPSAVKPPIVEYYLQGLDKAGLPIVSRGDAAAPLRIAIPEKGGGWVVPVVITGVAALVVGGVFGRCRQPAASSTSQGTRGQTRNVQPAGPVDRERERGLVERGGAVVSASGGGASELRFPFVAVDVEADDADVASSTLFDLGAQGVEERDATTLVKGAAGKVTARRELSFARRSARCESARARPGAQPAPGRDHRRRLARCVEGALPPVRDHALDRDSAAVGSVRGETGGAGSRPGAGARLRNRPSRDDVARRRGARTARQGAGRQGGPRRRVRERNPGPRRDHARSGARARGRQRPRRGGSDARERDPERPRRVGHERQPPRSTRSGSRFPSSSRTSKRASSSRWRRRLALASRREGSSSFPGSSRPKRTTSAPRTPPSPSRKLRKRVSGSRSCFVLLPPRPPERCGRCARRWRGSRRESERSIRRARITSPASFACATATPSSRSIRRSEPKRTVRSSRRVRRRESSSGPARVCPPAR